MCTTRTTPKHPRKITRPYHRNASRDSIQVETIPER